MLVGGNGGRAQGGQRGHVCCGGMRRAAQLDLGRVRRRGVCVCVLGSVQVLGMVQECAVCVQERAPAGLGAGSFESARRDKRESV